MSHVADGHDLIRVQGARENNLKEVSVEIPKRRLTVFTGVSGSGKSSLVFDTIAAESRRMIDETYSAFVQGFMPSVPRPDVDVLEGLTTAIIVDQERLGANPRSTVGTVTDANAMLRILFSKLGQPYIGGPTADGWLVKGVSASGFYPADKQISEFTEKQRHLFLYGEVTKVKISGINMTYEGLIPKITKAMLSKDLDALQPHVRAFVERVATFATCPECDGTRLTEGVRGLDLPGAGPLLDALRANLEAFVTLGLGYLSLERPSGTLSGGEAQRIKMLRHLGSSLTDVTYVFDEPTIGLHPHDIQRMNSLLLRLRDKGNTVLVV